MSPVQASTEPLESARGPDIMFVVRYAIQTVTAPDSMAVDWLNTINRDCTIQVQEILIQSRKTSIRRMYSSELKRFSIWVTQQSLVPVQALILKNLDYLLHLKQAGLCLNSIKVPIAAVSACHPHVQSCCLLSPHGIEFLKGLLHTYPLVRDPTSVSDFNLVLLRLMERVFEPFSECSLNHLSLKLFFLVDITSNRRVSGLQGFVVELPSLPI